MSVPIYSTRDLLRHRKLPATQTALSTLVTAFFRLVVQDSLPAALVRSAFFPALTASTTRPRTQDESKDWDERIKALFEHPPHVVVHQGVISPAQVDKAWAVARGEVPLSAAAAQGTSLSIAESVFIAFALNQELEQARAEGQREEEANLSMMVLASLSHELAHWVFVKVHGYHPAQPGSPGLTVSDTSSLHSMSRSSVNSVFLGPGNPDDVATQAVHLLFGVDFELLTLTMADRQVVKRKCGSRRPPAISPPVIYSLIGDTPAIRDVSAIPRSATGLHAILPWAEGDTMYTVTAILTPAGTNAFHGSCLTKSANAQFDIQLTDDLVDAYKY